MTSAWPMLTSSSTRSMLTQSTVNGHRSQGPTSQPAGLTDRWDPRVSAVQKEKEKGQCVIGPDLLPGFSSSWAFWSKLGPSPSLLLFFFAADSLGPRVGISGIPCGFFLIR